MWKVGDLSIDGRVVLGPMSGYTSEAYRLFMKPFGTALSYTEMVSDSAMMHNPRSDEYLMYGSCPFTGTQVFGSDPERMAVAAKECLRRNPNTDLFDVNMGCPVEKVVRRGAGSALMTDPARCGEIVRRVKRQTGIPVTAKIRLGQGADSMNFREVIAELEAAEVDAVTVHARTRKERYAGIPHYDAGRRHRVHGDHRRGRGHGRPRRDRQPVPGDPDRQVVPRRDPPAEPHDLPAGGLVP